MLRRTLVKLANQFTASTVRSTLSPFRAFTSDNVIGPEGSDLKIQHEHHEHTEEKSAKALQRTALSLPGRYDVFFKPLVVVPPTELNLEESTKNIHRLMSVAELACIMDSNIFGNDPNSFSLKRKHLHMPEHVQENNSRLLLSFSHDPMVAARYAGVDLIPKHYALVKTNIPPVFTIPDTHAKLDQSVFDLYHHEFRNRERHEAMEFNCNYRPPINPSELCEEQKEVDLVINTAKGECDFRPKGIEMLVSAHFICGGFRSYSFLSNPKPIHFNPIRRDWAIEILCPTDEMNYSKMTASSRNLGLIPPGSRPLTIDDAVALFPYFMDAYAPSFKITHNHVHILKFVPDSCEVGSRQAVQFLLNEHSLFRKRHNHCHQKHHHEYIETNDLSPASKNK